jgi:ABC-type phosphate/phosphonate transport system ATPase subunit
VLRARDLRLGYGRGPDILAGVDLDLDDGQTVAILGPSGGGKSTLLKAVAGLLAPRGGRLEVLGARSPARPPRGSVGYVPQRLGLVRHTSVLDNVLHGGLHVTPPLYSLLHRTPRDVEEAAHGALRQLGLADKADAVIHELSGGQQRRVAVARTLLQRPRLLLADEFLGELDSATTEVVAGAVKGLQRETGMGLLIVEHHLDQAMRLADRVYRLKGGRLLGLHDAVGGTA